MMDIEPQKAFPEGISLEDLGGTRILTYEWYSHFYIPLFIFFLCWDGFLLHYFIQLVLAHDPSLWGSLLFALPHITVGLFMTYYMIAIVVNVTTIEMGNGELKLTHSPLPWRGNQTVNMFDLKSVACERGRGSRRSPSADIVLYFTNGEKRDLISSIQNWDSARFIRDQVLAFRNQSLHLDDSPSPPPPSDDVNIWGKHITDQSSRIRPVNVLVIILLIVMAGTMFVAARSLRSLTTSSRPISPGPYAQIAIWEFRGDDIARVAVLDTYTDTTSKHSNWFSLPLVWKETDMISAVPIAGTVLEHYVGDQTYRDQSYRYHSYFIESDQRTFGCSATFATLPHLHITGETSRLISIGFDPTDEIAARTSSIAVVVIPNGVRDVAITDFQPYKTLTQNGRTLYYYDLKPITTHVSVHISYTLAGTSTTDIDLNTVMQNSKP
ncbi:MAG: hypothetical protein IPP66_15315 [Anaerolineales bacterium]|nr:hypothetical protein [Anaerolineales bacterium]